MRRRQRRQRVSRTDETLVRVVAPKRRGTYVLRWTDPDGTKRQRCTGIEAKKTLFRYALEQADELELRLNDPNRSDAAATWDDFCERYRSEHLAGLAAMSRKAFACAEGHFREAVRPGLMSEIGADTLSRFAAALRSRGIRETSVATYLRTIQAALSWATEVGILAETPRLRRPKRAKGVNQSRRGRIPSREEVERIIAKARELRPNDGGALANLIEGLWLSGLRIEESVEQLSWDWRSNFCVMLDGRFPYYKILAEGEKGHRDRLLPIPPDFAEWLQRTPASDRRGRVFKLRLAASTAGRWVSRCGRAAGVVVGEDGKCATAHDLRSAFGTRWARIVRPPTLQLMMRHESLETTMRYYVHLDAESVAAELAQAAKSGAYGGAAAPPTNAEELRSVVKELQAVGPKGVA